MKIDDLEGYEFTIGWWLLALTSLVAVISHLNMVASFLIESGLLLVGVVLLVISIYKAARIRSRRSVFVVGLVLLAGLAWISPQRQVASVYARAFVDAWSNSAIVEDVREGNFASCGSQDGCMVDSSAGLRIAFVWDGIIDNWYGMIYDPQGSVLDIRANKNVFGGDLVSSRHLWGPWYFCTFT